jgi:hypothetical protein
MVQGRPPGGYAKARTGVDMHATGRRKARGAREDAAAKTPIPRGRPPGFKKTKAHR